MTSKMLPKSGGSDASDCFSDPHGVLPPGVLGSDIKKSMPWTSWSFGSGFPLRPSWPTSGRYHNSFSH